MKLKTWQNGVNIVIDNVISLYNDGILLMENGSFGHACFSFYTAMEEIGVAYFIFSLYNNPNTNKLRSFLNHRKKMAATNLIELIFSAKPFGDMGELYRALLHDMKGDYRSGKKPSRVSKIIKDIQDKDNLWYLRNHGIYVSLNNDRTNFLSPSLLERNLAESIKKKLEFILPILKTERDMFMKFGAIRRTEIMASEKMTKRLLSGEKLNKAFKEGSTKRIENISDIPSSLKSFFIKLFLDKESKRYEELDIEISPERNNEDQKNVKKIIIYEFLKSIGRQLKEVGHPIQFLEKLKYRIERMQEYMPHDREKYKKIIPILEQILDMDSNLENIKELIKEYSF